MKRRAFLNTAAAASLCQFGWPAAYGQTLSDDGTQPLWPLWLAWRDRHLDFSGRVIDGPQRSASHSEGQGYGMVLAAKMGDGDAFRRMAEWTDSNLAIRSDNLLAWRWLPDTPERVPDLNNASDGDLFYAWALLLGAEKFGTAAWRERARGIAADLVGKCVTMRPDRPDTPVLLPAEYGFHNEGRVIFNPSYIMPVALRDLAIASGQAQLEQVAQSGLALMDQIAAQGLVPDWLELTADGPRPADGFSAHAGYEAIRIPLYLIWSGNASHRAVLGAAAAMAQAPRGQGATVMDSTSGAILETSRDAGFRAIAALADCAAKGGKGAAIPPFAADQPYYPATLHMFVLLAQIKVLSSCRPI
ncbi:MAG: glycosyl hydrolase family 5 [Rhodobacteraceae bacterium]|nr:glycosyl hydrolase family 5 [Paracoccaceae bacterium]